MYTILKNDQEQKVIYIDNDKKRLWHMRERVTAWVDYIPPGSEIWMITLTYDTLGTLTKVPYDWKANDIREFNLRMREELGDNLLGYAWVLELTQKGVPHYHYLCVIKEGVKIPYPDENGIWIKGLTRIEKARTPFYILKYTGKEYQKDFENYPKGARLFAIWMKNKRDQIRYKLLSEEEQIIVDRGGFDLLRELKKINHGLSNWHLVGCAVTFDFAMFMVENEKKWFVEVPIEEVIYGMLENVEY